MLKLRHLGSPNNAIWLVEPRVFIGSNRDCNLLLRTAGVAAKQVEIAVNHEDLQLTLLTEGAPTSINDRLLAVGASAALHVGDRLRIGTTELEVVDPKRVQAGSPVVTAAPGPTRETAWALKANHGALANRVYPIMRTTLLGRSSECDIVLAVAHLSRRHAQLSLRNNMLYVKDLGSVNGTWLNGARINEARVKRGDELRFDTLSFGVIGPSDDLDKTTIRKLPETQPKAPGPSPATDHSGAKRLLTDATAESSAPGPPSPAADAAPSMTRSAEQPVSAISGVAPVIIGAGLLLLVAAGILLAARQWLQL